MIENPFSKVKVFEREDEPGKHSKRINFDMMREVEFFSQNLNDDLKKKKIFKLMDKLEHRYEHYLKDRPPRPRHENKQPLETVHIGCEELPLIKPVHTVSNTTVVLENLKKKKTTRFFIVDPKQKANSKFFRFRSESESQKIPTNNIEQRINNMFEDIFSIDNIDKIINESQSITKEGSKSSPKKKKILTRNKYILDSSKDLKVVLTTLEGSPKKPISLFKSIPQKPTSEAPPIISLKSINYRNLKNQNQLFLQNSFDNNYANKSINSKANTVLHTKDSSFDNIVSICNNQLKSLKKTYKRNHKKAVSTNQKINDLFNKVFEGYKVKQEFLFAKEVTSYLKNKGGFIYGEKTGNYQNNERLINN